MSATSTLTETNPVTSLPLQAQPPVSKEGGEKQEDAEPYRYTHLLPYFSQDHYPALTPFDHVDPGQRALAHPNPRSFLDNATSIVQLTPNLGEDVRGINLATLDSDGRDQLALEVIFCSFTPRFKFI